MRPKWTQVALDRAGHHFEDTPGTSLGIGLLLFLAALNLFVFDIASMPYLYFDEVRYIPAAIQLNHLGVNENWSHPLLGKALMGLAVRIFGNGPLGWRFTSVFFGAVTVAAVFAWARALGIGLRLAVQAALLCLFNQLLYVQARLATLDATMVGLATAGMASFTYSLKTGRLRWMMAAGILLSLACSVKWAVLPLPCVCAAWLARRPARARMPLRKSLSALFLPAIGVVTLAGLAPLALRHPDYAPALSAANPLARAFQLWGHMLQAHLRFQNPQHPYASGWLSWPWLTQPSWYGYLTGATDGRAWVKTVVTLGNPLVFWCGALATLACGVGFACCREEPARASAGLLWLSVMSTYAVWACFPSRTTYFYYYLPAASFLPLALAWTAQRARWKAWLGWSFVALAAALFVFFYPALSGREMSPGALRARLWLPSWREPGNGPGAL